MSGTHEGGLKVAKTMKLRRGSSYYAEIGRKGGQVKGIKKGFALDLNRARLAGKKGGSISRRGKMVLERTTDD